MYLYYVYLITHKITGQFYIGSRTQNVRKKLLPEEDLWIKYFTTSKVIKSIIKEEGKDIFLPSIVFTTNNIDKCFWYEQDLIKKSISNPLCLNKSYHDPVTTKKIFLNTGLVMSQEQKDKISKSGKGIPRGPMSQSHKDNLKQKRSQETKDKISKARTGVSTGPRTKKQKAIAGAIWRGKKMPTQTCEYCLKQFSLLNYKRWHGFNCKINPN